MEHGNADPICRMTFRVCVIQGSLVNHNIPPKFKLSFTIKTSVYHTSLLKYFSRFYLALNKRKDAIHVHVLVSIIMIVTGTKAGNRVLHNVYH